MLTKPLFGLNQDSCRILVAQCSFSSLLVKLHFFSIGFGELYLVMAMDEHRPQCQGAIAGLKHGDGGDAANRPKCATGANILTLPAELQLEISNLLVYPDALSLKHTNRTFYGLVDTGVVLKIDWLVSRRKLHLECPNDRGCDLKSDLEFCRGSVA
ncbi:hypothetical protein EsDP_00001854 [Epichloe bromicola]|uniref:F-box domain-containing protein n=1 Tax=Epichloe bromicola TaxID=79588 RepID=A0ABQ0CJI0_9HYPO